MRTLKILLLLCFPMLISACSSSKASSETTSGSVAQVQNSVESDGNTPAQLEDRMPSPIGGLQAVYSGIRYPDACRRAGATGRVVVQLVINADGSIRDYSIIRGIHPACDREALRAVKRVKWQYGIHNGEPAAIQFQLPIVFSLD